MSYSGPPQQQQPYAPQPAPARKRAGLLLLGLIAVPLVVVLVLVVVLSRTGVIDAGPFAKKAPKVAPITQFPASAGGLYRVNAGEIQQVPVLAGSKYEWRRSTLYATVAPGETKPAKEYAEYMVDAYGSIDDVKDAFSDPKEVTEVGPGVCATWVLGEGVLKRQCGVNRGSIVVIVEGPYFGRDDQKLVGYANAVIEKVS
ncbi:hypothetical protein AB0L70_38430 [Kribbella sp. NPDC051952]|uniref:hypothetical protein n=1 Tax=Kribbella sp. NPDC051952 TaxID=3154851 RepID=UPI00341B8362